MAILSNGTDLMNWCVPLYHLATLYLSETEWHICVGRLYSYAYKSTPIYKELTASFFYVRG